MIPDRRGGRQREKEHSDSATAGLRDRTRGDDVIIMTGIDGESRLSRNLASETRRNRSAS